MYWNEYQYCPYFIIKTYCLTSPARLIKNLLHKTCSIATLLKWDHFFPLCVHTCTCTCLRQMNFLPNQESLHYSSDPGNLLPKQCPCPQILTDVINRSCTEFSIKFLCSQSPEVVDGKGPEVQHIVPRESVPLLHDNNFGSQEGKFYGSPQATWATSNN